MAKDFRVSKQDIMEEITKNMMLLQRTEEDISDSQSLSEQELLEEEKRLEEVKAEPLLHNVPKEEKRMQAEQRMRRDRKSKIQLQLETEAKELEKLEKELEARANKKTAYSQFIYKVGFVNCVHS